MSATLEDFVGSKLSWGRLVLRDTELSVTARVVASYLMHAMNENTRSAWAKRQTIADALGLSLKAITRALAELRGRGWIKSTVAGRGQANVIEPLFGKVAVNEQGKKAGPERPANTPEGGQTERKRWTRQTQKVDAGVPPIKELDKFPPSPQARGGQANIARLPAPRFRCAEVRDALVAAIGPDATVSYLDTAAWDEPNRTIVCRSSIGFERLQERASRTLAGLRVTVILDPQLFSRLPRPMLSEAA